MTTWVESKEVALLPGSYCTTLKAQTGATAWTDDELIECLEDEGFFVTAKPGAGKKRKRVAERRSKSDTAKPPTAAAFAAQHCIWLKKS